LGREGEPEALSPPFTWSTVSIIHWKSLRERPCWEDSSDVICYRGNRWLHAPDPCGEVRVGMRRFWLNLTSTSPLWPRPKILLDHVPVFYGIPIRLTSKS